MKNDYKPRVTGKQVLLDAATLAKDTGIFLIDLGKRVYNAVKTALAEDQQARSRQSDRIITDYLHRSPYDYTRQTFAPSAAGYIKEQQT